jgi:muramoyltetrapeptide carboxypeptidase
VNREKFDAGILRLRELGFNPVFSESIFNRDLFFAGGVRRRVDELHEMFRLPEVKAIICARGGYGSNHLLPHLNLGLIAHNPKIFCGYSDVTTLLTHFHDSLGLVGFHGPMVSKDFAHVDGVHFGSFSNASTGQLQWNVTCSDSPPLTALASGTAEGKLYGGCLSLLVASLGTPYEIRTADTILFLEDLGEWPYRIDRMLMHLRYAGKLERVRGIVFGEMVECSPPADSGYTLQEAIQRNLADLNIPIAFGLRSGHVSAGNITLPIGVRARLTVAEDVKLEILEAATVGRAESSGVGQR